MKTEWYTVAFDVRADQVQTIFQLLEGEARNFRFFKAKEQDPPHVVEVFPAAQLPSVEGNGSTAWRRRKPRGEVNESRTENTGRWVEKLWPEVKAILEASPGKQCRYDDPRIVDLMKRNNYGPSTAGPMLSELGYRKKIKRGEVKGQWALA